MYNTGSFCPEGTLIDTLENKHFLNSKQNLTEAFLQGRILEARAVVCTAAHDLVVDLGCMRGIIPRNEGAVGIADGSIRDIALISRVNKPVCFRIISFDKDSHGETIAILSRRAVQEDCIQNYISCLAPGDVIPAQVTHLEQFGCFADIGCGIISLIPIDLISISRISHPSDRFFVGQNIYVAVKTVENGRITLTHKELLGTWEENVKDFVFGETVAGIIRSVENYGVFVELTPNLAGLAELRTSVRPGQHAGVYIKSIIPEKMKIKLIIVDCFDASYPPKPPAYRITSGHISSWKYSPDCCQKLVETVF
ncbi:MAG: S1 RNA-binding domain-containing protein [Oscillospiraceae bacterium]|nr:S1 RNA-binding domain-containing protein [Oscillospiraceae bacterium]MBQ3048953.1 S1 RNA-binding domain-containing protein [Oscillospiraceae bacterium]